MINSDLSNKGYTQRQLRVGELVKQSLGDIFIKNETKISSFNSRFITVTEVRMTPDLKTARVYVIPLGGIDMKEIVGVLTDNAHLVRRALSKKLSLKFLPKLNFIEDKSFEYAEKIERLITVTEVRMTPDLKTARVYVIPLGGTDMKEIVGVLTDNAHLVRKALSKKLSLKFLPKLNFIEDRSFEYAEKIEKLIKENKRNETEKKRYN